MTTCWMQMLPNLSHEISPSPSLSTSTIKYKSDSLDQPEPGVQRQEAQGNGYVCNWKVIWRKPQFVFIFICDHHSSNRFPILFLLTRSTGQDDCFITPPPVFSLRSHRNLKEVVWDSSASCIYGHKSWLQPWSRSVPIYTQWLRK